MSCSNTFTDLTCCKVAAACAEWNRYSEAGNLVLKSSIEHSNTQYPVENSLNQITKGDRGLNKYLMQCYTYWDWWTVLRKDCYEADIDINTSFTWANSKSYGVYFVQDVMTHEIGHLCGLNDLYGGSDTLKTMYGYASTNEDLKCTLAQDDIDGLHYIY